LLLYCKRAGLISGYYDLYTTPDSSLNVYFDQLRGRLGFKNLAVAEQSVNTIDETYQRLSELKDRAGQHHCLVAALTMFNRARYIGKSQEAEVFRQWILKHLSEKELLH